MAYEVLTDKWPRVQRFASLKANAILNIVESVFWLAAMIVIGMSIGRCRGVTCALGGIIITIVIVLL
jgi:hypothetical protein